MSRKQHTRNAMGPQGPSQRQLRAGELIRHALVDVLREQAIHDEALAGVSITTNCAPCWRAASRVGRRREAGAATTVGLSASRRSFQFAALACGSRSITSAARSARAASTASRR